MKIGFDARLMSVPGGIGRYCRELLLNMSAQNPDTSFVVLVKSVPEDFPERDNIEWIEIPIHWYTIAEQFKLGKLMNRRFDISLWHIPHWNVPFTLQMPFVMTIHDFIFEEYPTHDDSFWGKLRFMLYWGVWRMLLHFNTHRARAIFTVSHYVAGEISRRFPWTRDKIVVTPLGISDLFLHAAPSQTPAPARPFFLVVGNSYPHKNHEYIFETWRKHPEMQADIHIVTHRDRFSEAEQQRNTDDRIHFLFDLSDEAMLTHYQTCTALIFPSLSEGFGIPPLEAFALGKPVIAGKNSSLPEVLGNAATWVDLHDTESLAHTIRALLVNPTAGAAERIHHAQKFSWKTTALSTHALYKKVV